MRLPRGTLAAQGPGCGTVRRSGERMDRNDAIAWAVATGVWLAVLALFLWLAAGKRSRRGALRWAWPRLTAGLVLWLAVFGATRWAERSLGLRGESTARAVRPTRAHSAR